VLIPSKIDFNLSAYSGNISKVDNRHISNAVLKFGYNKLFFTNFTDSSSSPVFNMNFSNKKLLFDSVVKIGFDEKRKLIDDYYLSELQMADAEELLGKIDYKDVDMAVVYDIRLMDVEKIVNILFQKDFPAKLYLSSFDPINYIDKFNKLSSETIKARNELNKNLAVLDKLLYEKGVDFLKKNDLKNAVLYFNKTVDYNKYYAPAHYQLARLLFRKDSIYRSAEIITGVFKEMNPDPETYKNLILLSDSLMKSFMINGNYFLKTEKYNEAVECFENLIKFCSSSSGLKCSDEAYKNLSLARFGIFKSYLDVSKRAIDGNRLNLAEVYVLEAKAFQKKHSSDIINDEEADAMMFRLAKAYVLLGDSSLKRRKFEKAQDYYAKAIMLCDSNFNENYKCPEEISYKISLAKNGLFEEIVRNAYQAFKEKNISRAEAFLVSAEEYRTANPKDIIRNTGFDSVMFRVKTYRYLEFVKEAKYLSVFASYDEMISRMKLAKELELKYKIKPSSLMDSLIAVYAKPYLYGRIKSIFPLVNDKKLDSAKLLCDMRSADIKELLLNNDTSLNNKITELRSFINHTECTVSMNRFNDSYKQAIEMANLNEYIYSSAFADTAMNIALMHPDCSIDTADIASIKQTNKKPAFYQSMIIVSNNNYFRNNFDSSLFYYFKAEKYFITEKISNTGLKHKLVEDFVIDKDNEKFTFFAVNYMADSSFCDKSFYLLKSLEKKSYLSVQLKSEQQKLGRVSAIHDKRLLPTSKAAANLKARTGKDKWFKYYKNAYYKAWHKNRFYYVIFTIF
jgi:tetratricopeptide (TPR) repeat protein